MACNVFGLTGGIGSGKSTVAQRWRARGLPVVDADELARQIVAPGSEGLHAIVSEFGAAMLHDDGSLDRGALARLVFADTQARRQLESITHPRVHARLEQVVEELTKAEQPLACYEAPLLIETGRADQFRPVVVVTVPEDVQVVRTMRREGTDSEPVVARLRSQAPLSKKIPLADHLIDNSGPLGETIRQADSVLDRICDGFGIDPGRFPRPPMDAA